MVGSIVYVCPDVLVNENGYGKAIDWWGLGALIYEMLIGQPPYYSQNNEQIFINKQHLDVDIPNELPDFLKDFLQQLLTRDPKKRLGTNGNIKQHAFFKGFDFQKLLSKELKAPFRPLIESDTDIKFFDLKFEESPESFEDSNKSVNLSNFTYNATESN